MIPTLDMTGRQTVEVFHKVLSEKGWSYTITPKWEGWERSGVLEVRNEAGEVVHSVTYKRGTQHWGPQDEKVIRLRNGSRRHQAIRGLVAEMLEERVEERVEVPAEYSFYQAFLMLMKYADRRLGPPTENQRMKLFTLFEQYGKENREVFEELGQELLSLGYEMMTTGVLLESSEAVTS